MKMARSAALVSCLVPMLLVPVLVSAEPVALVLDVQGDVSPQVRAFDEIDADTTLTLGSGGALTIEHYVICEQVTFRGGTLVVEEEALNLDEARLVARRPVECPEVVQLPDPTANAGVIVRNVASGWRQNAAPRIGLTPSILVPGIGGTNDLRIERDGDEVATLPVVDSRSVWPEGTRPLVAGEHYELVLSDGNAFHRLEVVADQDARRRLILRLPVVE